MCHVLTLCREPGCASNFPYDFFPQARRIQKDKSSNAFSVAVGFKNFHSNVVVFVVADVAIQHRTVSIIGDENIQVAIFLIVEDDNAATVKHVSDAFVKPRFLKSSCTVIVLEKHVVIETRGSVVQEISVSNIRVIKTVGVN